MPNAIDTSILNSLSPAEREMTLKILQEFQEKGKSALYNDLIYSDFDEIPVDINTFIEDDNFLGKAWKNAEGKLKIFPYWQKKLRELFPDNIHTNFNTFIESGGRGLGKSEVAVTVMLYLIYRLMCLKDPFQYYNLKVTEKFCFAFMNITKDLAAAIGVSKFQNTVQMSPWFMSRGKMTGRDVLLWNPPDYIDIIIGSQPSDVIGKPIFAAFFDEVSFQRNASVEKQKQKAYDLINTAIGGMKTRFTNKGKNPTLLILASSKRSESSFLEEHIKKKNETDKEATLIVDEPTWNIRPPSEYSGVRFWVALGNRYLNSEVLPLTVSAQELDVWRSKGYKLLDVPIEYHANFLEDIDRALCDFAGVSSSDLTTYISGSRWNDCINVNTQNPFTKEILEIGNNPADTQQYYEFFDLSKIPNELKSRPLYIHLDMSTSGDKTGIAGVWIVNRKTVQSLDPNAPESKELFFRLCFSVAIKAPKGYQISFEKHRQFIYWLKANGFNIKGISSDTFQSSDMKQSMISKGFDYETVSVDRVSPNEKVCLPYQYFKSTIYEKRIQLYPTQLLTDEIVGLEKNNDSGKVDHSSRGVDSKDIADACCLHPDTKIFLLSGKHKTIQELYENRSNLNEWILAYNTESHKIEPVKIYDVINNGYRNDLIQLTLDTGEKLTCTSDHKLLCRDGTYIEARDALNCSLMPFVYEYKIMYPNREYPSMCIPHRKVVDIQPVQGSEVYDLVLDKIHNFAICSGIFVHNCGAVWNASKHSEEFSFEFGDDLPSIMDASVDERTTFNLRQQVNIDFEKEMKSLLDPLARSGIINANPAYVQNQGGAIFNFDDGIVVW